MLPGYTTGPLTHEKTASFEAAFQQTFELSSTSSRKNHLDNLRGGYPRVSGRKYAIYAHPSQSDLNHKVMAPLSRLSSYSASVDSSSLFSSPNYNNVYMVV